MNKFNYGVHLIAIFVMALVYPFSYASTATLVSPSPSPSPSPSHTTTPINQTVPPADVKQEDLAVFASVSAAPNRLDASGFTTLANLILKYYRNEFRTPESFASIKQELDAGADPNLLVGKRNLKSALHLAMEREFLPDLVALLLKNGADPNLRTGRGISPLFYALKHRTPEGTELLLNAGADPNKPTKISKPFDKFALSFVRSLRGHEKYKIAKLLLDYGADVHASSNGLSLLLRAVLSNDLQMARLLVSYGADVDKGNPLFHAAKRENYGMVLFLLDSGADANQQTEGDLYTPLHAAFFNKNRPIYDLLLQRGASPSIKNVRGSDAYWDEAFKAAETE